MKVYLDTSAIISAVSDEPQSDNVRALLKTINGGNYLPITSMVGKIETLRIAQRNGLFSEASLLLSRISVIDISPEIVDTAIALGSPKGLEYIKTLDAIHVATALVSDVNCAVTLDEKQASVFNDVDIIVKDGQ